MKCGFSHSALFAVAGLVGHVAHAAPGDATRLEYARSARAALCPDQAALESAVKKRLGYDPFFPVARQTVVVEIVDSDSGLRAQMRLVDDRGIIQGSRELSEKAENCGELVASLALAISIALDPSAALGAEPAVDVVAPPATAPKKESDPSQPESPPTPATDSLVAAPAPTPKRRATARGGATSSAQLRRGASPFVARAQAFSSIGVAPALAFGARLGATTRSAWFQFILELSDQAPSQRAAANGGDARASLLSGTVAPCVAWKRLAACVPLALGSLRAEGRNVDHPVAERTLYIATGARAEFTPTLVGELHLLLNIESLKSLTPVTLRVHGEDVWQTPFLSFAAGLGFELRFP